MLEANKVKGLVDKYNRLERFSWTMFCSHDAEGQKDRGNETVKDVKRWQKQ